MALCKLTYGRLYIICHIIHILQGHPPANVTDDNTDTDTSAVDTVTVHTSAMDTSAVDTAARPKLTLSMVSILFYCITTSNV